MREMGERRTNLLSRLPELFREVEVNYDIITNSRASPDVQNKIRENLKKIREEFVDKILPFIDYEGPDRLREWGYSKEKVEADEERVSTLFESRIKAWLEEKKDKELKELPEEIWRIDKEG